MTASDHEPCVIVITGVSAAGKSTVAQALAERLPRSVHVRGDSFRRMIVNGRVDMTVDAFDEAVSQLRLRYRLSARVADGYAAAGFTAIVQDVIVGRVLGDYLDLVQTRPRYLVVLAPTPDVVAAREEGRAKTAYGSFTVERFDELLRTETPRLGLWLDTSELTVDQTVDQIVARLDEASA